LPSFLGQETTKKPFLGIFHVICPLSLTN